MHNIGSYLKHSNISKSPFRFRMETYLKNCGFDQFITNDTKILYTTTLASGKTYEIKFTKNRLSGTGNAELIGKEDLFFNKISFISEYRNIIPLWNDKASSLTGGYLGFYFHEVNGDFNLATESLKEIDLKFLDLKFAVKKINSGKKFTIQSLSNEYFEIELKNSSSGAQSTVPISLITQYFSTKFNFEDAFNVSLLKYLSNNDKLTDFKAVKNLGEINKKIYIHIEEPELSLFPEAQTKLLNEIVYKCFVANSNRIELFISTHSPYIINHLNLLIKAFDKMKSIDGAHINYDELAVFQIVNGHISDLIVMNERLVNTNLLSETIDNIYNHYSALD